MTGDCPIRGCGFEMDDGAPPIAQMLLTYPDVEETPDPFAIRAGTFLCPECHTAFVKSTTPEEFVDERFGDDVPPEVRA